MSEPALMQPLNCTNDVSDAAFYGFKAALFLSNSSFAKYIMSESYHEDHDELFDLQAKAPERKLYLTDLIAPATGFTKYHIGLFNGAHLVGTTGLMINDDFPEEVSILEFSVHPDYRGQQYLAELMRLTFEAAEIHGWTLTAEIRPSAARDKIADLYPFIHRRFPNVPVGYGDQEPILGHKLYELEQGTLGADAKIVEISKPGPSPLKPKKSDWVIIAEVNFDDSGADLSDIIQTEFAIVSVIYDPSTPANGNEPYKLSPETSNSNVRIGPSNQWDISL